MYVAYLGTTALFVAQNLDFVYFYVSSSLVCIIYTHTLIHFRLLRQMTLPHPLAAFGLHFLMPNLELILSTSHLVCLSRLDSFFRRSTYVYVPFCAVCAPIICHNMLFTPYLFDVPCVSFFRNLHIHSSISNPIFASTTFMVYNLCCHLSIVLSFLLPCIG